jgi:uncharacterized protein (DUF433 family)
MSDEAKHKAEEEIDDIVIAQADDESAWENPIQVFRSSERLRLEQLSRLPITSDPEILSGATVFRGTRVPVAALFDNLAANLTLEEFLDNFPTVKREQALQILEFFKDTLSRLGQAA